jgi:DNA polymerase (family 10)
VTDTRPLTLGRAWDLLDRCIASIRMAYPTVQSVEPGGEIRQSSPLISRIVVVVCGNAPDAIIKALASSHDFPGSVLRGERQLNVSLERTEVEIHVASPDDYGTVLWRATGTAAHVRALTARALSSQRYASEEQLYSSLGLSFIPSELRKGKGEIEAAASGRLPRLVESADIRGDLHMHSLYSDGRDPVPTMLAGCHALGYEYVAMTDHSWRAAAGRTLAVDAIGRQRDEIDSLRDRFPGMTILHGVEVDIMTDGRLDFEDAVLEQFDIVLASLHDRSGHDGAQLTRRSLEAIRHPLVNVLCHPANQLIGRDSGYALDFEAIYAAARETGTALEVDGAPTHLDLDGERARAAIAAGVTLTIDSDCHRVEALARQMSFGVGTARRGWVEARHVLNTRSLTDLRSFIAAKRRGRPTRQLG